MILQKDVKTKDWDAIQDSKTTYGLGMQIYNKTLRTIWNRVPLYGAFVLIRDKSGFVVVRGFEPCPCILGPQLIDTAQPTRLTEKMLLRYVYTSHY